MLVKKGEEKKLKVTVDICDSLQAPVSKNQTLGMVDITLDNKSIKQYKIASVREVKKLNLIDSFMMVLNYISTGNCSYPF
jgi:D-alanyl-D-alanine carboxypeptidase